jgi:hypothetical protein
MNILFLNHGKSQCGVYNYGTRIFDIWKKSDKLEFIYSEVNSLEEYNQINFDNFKFIFYNYHVCTMEWLNSNTITKKSINIGILHECYPQLFHYCINTQSDIPRPIFESIPSKIQSNDTSVVNFLEYGLNTDIPIVGSFGFGFTNKGFDKIVNYVNQQFDKAIIKIIMPFADYGDKTGEKSRYVSSLCSMANQNPSIEILIIHEFLHDNDILYFLNNNTVNVFLYDRMEGRGISSTIDFAMSVNTPLCISDSYMFRHIYSDSICLYKRPFNECITNSTEYMKQFRELYSHRNSIKFIEDFIDSK